VTAANNGFTLRHSRIAVEPWNRRQWRSAHPTLGYAALRGVAKPERWYAIAGALSQPGARGLGSVVPGITEVQDIRHKYHKDVDHVVPSAIKPRPQHYISRDAVTAQA
jgi:hypothetical protein